MEQPKQTGTPTQATPTGTFNVKIEKTTYMVGFTSTRLQKTLWRTK